MIRFIKIGICLFTIGLCLVGCSNDGKQNEVQSELSSETTATASYIDGVHDVIVDEDSDPQEMFNKLIEGVTSSGYSLNVSNVLITKPGKYEAYWIDEAGNKVTCTVTVREVATTTEEVTTEQPTEQSTEAPEQSHPDNNPTPPATTEETPSEPTTEAPATTEEEKPQGRSISGVHNVTKSYADTSWNTSSVLFELQSGVTCNGDMAQLTYSGGQVTGPGTYTYTWIWSDGSVAATCYLYVTD